MLEGARETDRQTETERLRDRERQRLGERRTQRERVRERERRFDLLLFSVFYCEPIVKQRGIRVF